MKKITELFTSNHSDIHRSDNATNLEPLSQIVWTVLMAIVIVVGTVGNSIIIWIVLAHQNMRSVTNLFIVNLALADGLVALFGVPFESFQIIYGYWPFRSFMCKLYELFSSTNIGVSILTLTMISLDRYEAIIYPFKRRMGRGKAITIMIAIWLISIVIMSPNWISITTYEEYNNGRAVQMCRQIWSDHFMEEIYRIGSMIILYLIPLIYIGISYGNMAAKLWGHATIGEQSEKHFKNKRAKRRTVKMLITVVLLFTVCWLPLHLVFIATSVGLLTSVSRFLYQLLICAFWLAMSNSMFNPIVYCLMNARFRAGFKKALRWWPWVHYDAALDDIHFASITLRKSMSEPK